MNKPYYVYMLRCADSTIYTGITTDPIRREHEHTAGGDTHARYTAAHPGVRFERVWITQGRSAALKLEWRIKRLPREVKEELITYPAQLCDRITDIDASRYRVYEGKQCVDKDGAFVYNIKKQNIFDWEEQPMRVMQWNSVDIPVATSRPYRDAYRDASVTARFTHESGRTLTLAGFWDGENKWLVRFAPDACGKWTYSIAFEGEGPCAQGELEAVPYEGDNPLYQHGFLRVSDNQRYLTYADGTPFFWLGDTHWLALGGRERLEESNCPLFSSMFRGTADFRKMQDFTVYQMNFFLSAAGDCDGTGTSNEGGKLWLDKPFGTMNPAFFRNTDERIRYLVSIGIVPCLGMDWGGRLTEENFDEMARAVRYVIARYAALPVIWFAAGEYAGSPIFERWSEIGQLFEDFDPYAHVTTIHGNGENFCDRPETEGRVNADHFRAKPWFDMVMIQTGHEPNTPRRNIWRYYYDRTPVKPILESENAYEGIWEVREPLTREQAYLALMHGSFGVTYGAEGVWDATWDEKDYHQVVGSWWPIPWYDALFLPQAKHFSYIKRVFESVSWWKLEPGEYLRIGNPTNTMRDIVAKADSRKNEILVYYISCPADYETDVTVIDLTPGACYTAQWYNPSTGEFLAAGELTVDGNGELLLPARPVKRVDRMLVLKKK